ncbi:MAG: glycerol kinase GlpK [Synergistaceae bacterium]|jgi:glycerol kinase|nr:glycerol kinase GlpK [Synergistaceae bacterium]
MSGCILAIDQGTSGTKALVFDRYKNVLAKGHAELRSIFPRPGFVEQYPDEILDSVLSAVRDCLARFRESHPGEQITAAGISNQRETFVLWDETGKPLCNAVVWQCKRSIDVCAELKPREATIRNRTGLLADPYFSGTKVAWLYRNDPAVREAIDARRARFGTVDAWLLWRLAGEYATDHTNASRTMFLNLETGKWDAEMLEILGLGGLVLPEIRPSSAYFGETDFGGQIGYKIPINAMIGDSQAAALGEGCTGTGVAKATLGTGSSMIMNVGNAKFECVNMVRTICYSHADEIDYGIEGIVVSCGSPIQWLRDELRLFGQSRETEDIAGTVPDAGGVFLLPAFSGMGAPFWNMTAKGQIAGLTFGAKRAHIVRAALESIAYQIRAVLESMEAESGVRLSELRTDGGISANKLVREMIATLLGRPVTALDAGDISAMGAALLAGLGCGIYGSVAEMEAIPASGARSEPVRELEYLHESYAEWTRLMKKL